MNQQATISAMNGDDTEGDIESLYIVLVGTPGIFASMIRKTIDLEYVHVVLGMDRALEQTYSFGRRDPKVPLFSGFTQEDFEKVVEKYPNATCLVSKIDCTKEQKTHVIEKLQHYIKHSRQYKYCIAGLPFILMSKPFHQKHHYTCSQFLARLLQDCNIRKFDKHYSVITPRDFYEMPDKQVLYRGTLREYLGDHRFSEHLAGR